MCEFDVIVEEYIENFVLEIQSFTYTFRGVASCQMIDKQTNIITAGI
jgi:hypothetical protein